MAMVKALAFLPTSVVLQTIRQLGKDVRYQELTDICGRVKRVDIVDSSGCGVNLEVDYYDIEFKFECLYLLIAELKNGTYATQYMKSSQIKCIFRFECKLRCEAIS